MTENKKEDPELRILRRMKEKGMKGAHLCPDWDFMAICDGDAEMECCTCEQKTKNNADSSVES